MADDAEAYLNQFDPSSQPSAAAENEPDKGGTAYLDRFDPSVVGQKANPYDTTSSATGAFARSAERSALPTAGGLAGAAAGAEAGGALGSIAGPIGAGVGAFGGGVAGAILGGGAVESAQNWAVSKLPEGAQAFLGGTEKQQQADWEKHGVASLLGGVAPYMLTASPGFAIKELPAGATRLEQLLNTKTAQAAVGGTVMGGITLGQELTSGHPVDWTNVAVSTGLGMFWNKPNKLGETIMGAGAAPFQHAPGEVARPEPTIAEAGDLKVAGPGVTEDVYQGTENQAKTAEAIAQDARRQEMTAAATPPAPDIHAAARQMEPEVFARYDAAQQRFDSLQSLFERTGEEEGPQQRALSDRLVEARAELNDLGPEVGAAYRRAAEATGSPVEPAETPATPEGQQAPEAAPTPQREEMAANIADDVKRQLVAAGISPEQADARSQLEAAFFDTLSAKGQGAFGSAQDLYNQHGPIWKQQPPKVRPDTFELAQKPPEEGREFNQLAGETPEESALTVNDILHPDTQGLPPRSSNVEDIASGLMDRGSKALKALGFPSGRIEGPNPKSDEVLSRAIASEIQGALTRGGRTASDWYTGKVKEAMAVAAAIHPELATDDNARTAFTAGLAITSQGETVPSNVRLADQVYSRLRETGRFPTDIAAKNGPAMNSNFRKLNALLDELGPDGTRDFLHRQFTVKELEQAGYDVGGENKGTSVYGSAVLGPKIGGGFFQNLNGNFNPVTMDLWFMRAWGRLTGTLVGKTDISKPRSRFEKALESEDHTVPKTVVGLVSAAKEIVKTHERSFARNRPAYDSGEMSKSELTLSAERLLHNTQGINEQPTSGSQRVWMRDRVARAREILGENGIDVTPADLQAIWWYPEKELYAKLGGRDSEGINVDYASALRELASRKGIDDATVENSVRTLANRPGSASEADVGGGGQAVGAEGQEPAREFAQSAKGKVRFVAGRRPLITLFKNADFSTLIHEGAHNYLEIMGQYAEHPDAPPALKDDWQTIKDWLKVNDRSEIRTRAHEQFARGFEQYVREGVAPSQKLARAFAQFKQWMVSIYRSVAGLGKPISDDIRNVFDRMLAEEPHPTVIAPNADRPPSLADIHEADARLTEPKEAEPAMARVEAETLQREAELPAHVRSELGGTIAIAQAHDLAREAAAGGDETGSVGNDGGESGTKPGGASDGAGSGEKLGSGGGPGKESPGASGGAGPESIGGRDAGRGAGHPLAPTPRETSRPNESRFVDRAGNIRLDNIIGATETEGDLDKALEDIKQVFRDTAAQNGDFLADRRGVVTDGEVLQSAYTILGSEPDFFLAKKIGQAFSAEENKAIQALGAISAKNVVAKMQAVRDAAPNSPAAAQAVVEYAKAKAFHQGVQAKYSQATAESGRALRALRKSRELWTPEVQSADDFVRAATGKTLFQMEEEARLGAGLGTPEQVSKFVADSGKYSYGRMLLEYWVNGLISGRITHTTYAVGNTILAGERALFETPTAYAIGAARQMMGREGNVIPFGEMAAQIRGARQGVAPALTAAADALRTGLTTSLPGEANKAPVLAQNFQAGTFGLGASMKEDATFADARQAWYGLARGMKDGIVSAGALLSAGGVEHAPLVSAQYTTRGVIPNIAVKGVPGLPLGDILRGPGRFIASIHSFFRAMNYSIEINGQEYRQAWNEGKRGDDLAQRVADLSQTRTPERMEAARFEANEATLMGQGGKFTKTLGQLTNLAPNLPLLGETPILKFIDPFVHISSAIVNQALLQRTPLGILAPTIRADILGKNGPIAADKAAARMLVGSAMAIAFGALAAEGYVTGGGPQDPRQAAMWKLAGNQAHSVKLGDTWYDLHRLGPIGMLLGMAADLYDSAHAVTTQDLATGAAHLQHAIAQNVLDESFMRGPADLINALQDKTAMERYVRDQVSSFTPFSVGSAQVARAVDPYSRQARTVIDAIKQKVPGMSQQLLPRRDIWGNPIQNPAGLGGLTAIWERNVSHDPVNIEMNRLGVAKAQPERRIRNVTLTDQQYDDMQRISGRMTKERLDQLVKSGSYERMADPDRREAFDQIFSKSREAARGVMMMKYPQILRDSTDRRRARATGADIRAIGE